MGRSASPPRAPESTSCVRRTGARSCAEIRRCRAAAAPDRLGFHLAQAGGAALEWCMPQVRFVAPPPPRPAGTQPRQSADRPGKEYGPPQRYPPPNGRYDTLRPFSRPHPPKNNVMIPSAFESEISKIPPMDEVLRRDRSL